MFRRKAPLIVVATIVCVAIVGYGARRIWRTGEPFFSNGGTAVRSVDPPVSPSRSDSRLAVAARWPNVHPDVRYVDEATCGECHAEIARDYARHPMGRSLRPMSAASSSDAAHDDLASAEAAFAAAGFHYQVTASDGRTTHRETLRDANGETAVQCEATIDFVVGSGRNGNSYMFQREGALWMSPITWYPKKNAWDLSPGYEKKNAHFSRPVLPACLYCHANRALPVADTVNSYHSPYFEGHAIGCQRCHGPGDLHVKKQAAPTGGAVATSTPDGDRLIVNPRRLDSPRRDAVCEQCHLSGSLRVARRDRDPYEYRPGMPLQEFISVFLSTSESQERKFVGHVEQMRASRCFQASDGRMGCISCHDPHRRPAAGEEAEYFRRRCLECHPTTACRAPPPARAATLPADNCLSCHMPAKPTDVRHTATTDHTIPRRRGDAAKSDRAAAFAAPDAADDVEGPLRSFYGREEPFDPQEAERDLAIALVMTADLKLESIRRPVLESARRHLEAACRRRPDDVEALEAWGHAQWRTGDALRARQTFEQVLKLRPRREFALASLAGVCQSLDDHRSAGEYWRRAIEINPADLKYNLEFALSAAKQHDWEQCRRAAERSLELNATSFGAHQLLVESLLGLGRQEAADERFALLLRLQLRQASALQAWYDRHPLRRRP